MSEMPQKEFYRLSEVCRFTDTQPYVLRFWESEFPQLRGSERGAAGQRLYSREDIDLVQRIKQLLYEEEYTLAGAREKLEAEQACSAGAGPSQAGPTAGRRGAVEAEGPRDATAARAEAGNAPRPGRLATGGLPFEPPDAASVPRRRYEDAIDEIDHLRLRLKEAEKLARKAESAHEEAARLVELQQERLARAAARIEQLLVALSAADADRP